MVISLNTQHLKRYRDIAWLLLKYGRSDLVATTGSEALGEAEPCTSGEVDPKPEELASDLEKLGPSFVKLGQLLSTRSDLLPPAYLQALARLQDKVEPFPCEEVERIITAELGVRISKAFSEFDSTPIAAASLGQVHRARLRDGRPVVVKVQRPGIREQIIDDLAALEEAVEFLDSHTEIGRRYEFENMLTELRKTLLRELDYRQEASNLILFRENLKEFAQIVVPRPIEDYTTSRVLTMECVSGQKITLLHPVARIDLNGTLLAEELFHAYLKQILVDGFFHADPHPGNVFITAEGRIALLDLGMVARLATGLQENLLRLLLAISEGRGEEAAQISMKMGEPKDKFDEREYLRRTADLVAAHQATGLRRIEAGKVVLEITRLSADCGFRLPPEFTLIGKALLNLDQIVYTLSPEFDPNGSIRRHANGIIQQRLVKSLAPGNLLSSVLEVKEFIEKLPGRVNNILDLLGNNKLSIKVDAIDEKSFLEGFQKIANRITLGLVLAALIIGASMLMRVETTFRILGYPGLPMLFFIIAAGGGIALAINIVLTDEKARKSGSDKSR